MTETKFVPGPWPAPKVSPSGTWLIGEMPPIAGTRAKGNADLIATAPEMYAVIEEWLTVGNNLAERKAIRAKARAVLARARGETA